MMRRKISQKNRRAKGGVRGIIGGGVMLFAFMGLMLTGCGKEEKAKEILVGAAASLKPVMEELQTVYGDENPDVTVTFNFAGSGTLEQQIREGAPIDLFISAAEKQMDSLSKDDLILEDTRVELLRNQLVLVVPKDSTLGISGFEDISKAPVIAVGDPESVPAGQYAKEVFDSIGITQEVEGKATYGKDVTEVLAWVSSGDADAGVVYATDAISDENVTIAAYAPEGSHSKIVYPAAVIKASGEAEGARSFLEFLGTQEAEDVFVEYGFEVIDD